MQLSQRRKHLRVTGGVVIFFLSLVSLCQNLLVMHRMAVSHYVDLSLPAQASEVSLVEEDPDEGSSSPPVVQLLQRDSNFSRLPRWYHDYVDWHRNTLEQLNETNWSDQNYVLLRCVRRDDRCFGTADRLKMVPVMILMAAQTSRLFFIHWSRPAALEEFLVPNQINWTVPSWLHPLMNADADRPIWRMGRRGRIGMYNYTEKIIRIKSMVYAFSFYDEQRSTEDEPVLWEVYHDFWNALFLPAPPIQERIDVALREMDLYEDSSGTFVRPFVSVHVRSQYAENLTDSKEEENAIRCATHLQNELQSSALFFDDTEAANVSAARIPIYVAADTAVVTRRAVEYGRAHDLLVVGRPQTAEDPWHLDRQEGMPAQFYDTFVDLYLLSLGECYAWGLGGFGSWAAALGHSARGTCPSTYKHFKTKCEFASDVKSVAES